MGNCFATCIHRKLEDEKIQIMKVEDSKVLEYKPPLRVKDVLLHNPRCEIVIQRDEQRKAATGDHTMDSTNASMPLPRDHSLIPGNMYYIIRRKDRGDNAKRSLNRSKEEGVVRVKIVLTRQELAQLLSRCEGKGGTSEYVLDKLKRIGRDEQSVVPRGPCRDAWRPVLETIPEEP